jgi:hypothetical protein
MIPSRRQRYLQCLRPAGDLSLECWKVQALKSGDDTLSECVQLVCASGTDILPASRSNRFFRKLGRKGNSLFLPTFGSASSPAVLLGNLLIVMGVTTLLRDATRQSRCSDFDREIGKFGIFTQLGHRCLYRLCPEGAYERAANASHHAQQ